jgi:hypothetical protein
LVEKWVLTLVFVRIAVTLERRILNYARFSHHATITTSTMLHPVRRRRDGMVAARFRIPSGSREPDRATPGRGRGRAS